jgi:glycosyltransferase involved in cell wall biosynthesis
MNSPKPTPLVSVIMNAYYSEEYLAEAIESVVEQTYSNWEIILWENESSDRTREISESFNDPRIRYFFAEQKVSLYESRMNAFNESRGELIAFLDCDDFWMPEKLRIQVEVFTNRRCALTCSDFLVQEEGDAVRNGRAHRKRISTYEGPTSSVFSVAMDYRVGMSSLMVRRESAERVWLLHPPAYSKIEDFDMVIRLMTVGELIPTTTPLMVYRWHGKNFTLNTDIAIDETASWITSIDALPLSLEERNQLRNKFELEILNLECHQLLKVRNRSGAWKFAQQMPFGIQRMKWSLKIILPFRVFVR